MATEHGSSFNLPLKMNKNSCWGIFDADGKTVINVFDGYDRAEVIRALNGYGSLVKKLNELVSECEDTSMSPVLMILRSIGAVND